MASTPGRLAALELLASSFFGEEATLPAEGNPALGQLGFDPFPNEVALGLYAIDYWTKQGRVSTAGLNSIGNQLDLRVDELLDQVLAFPEEHTPESHHLAFLKFAGWYSTLLLEKTSQFRSSDRWETTLVRSAARFHLHDKVADLSRI